MSNINIKLAAGTHVGNVRKNNEDNFIVNKDLEEANWILPNQAKAIPLGKYGSLFVVADGMGGANAGEIASAITVETIQKLFSSENLSRLISENTEEVPEKDIEKYIKDAIKSADLNIIHKTKEDESTQGMGTTIVLLWLLKEKAYISWCGDSRCYVFNPSNGLTRLTKDHSYVQDLVDEGKLSQENTFDHPYNNIITRCLGDSQTRAVPDFRSYIYQPNDLFLLCSDGLSDMCRDEEIMKILIDNYDNLINCRDLLFKSALEAGGYDNITILLCSIIKDNLEKEPCLTNTIPSKPQKHTFRNVFLFLLCITSIIGYFLYPKISQGILNYLSDSADTIIVNDMLEHK